MLILASSSPRRQQLLALSGWDFSIKPAEIDERPLPGEHPGDYTLRLAQMKARSTAAQVPADAVVVAADTTVADLEGLSGAEILGKPADAQDARRMLVRLRGRVHHVYTALAVYRRADEKLLSELCTTGVKMRNYSDAEIEEYIASGDPLDKAGAYAIQNSAFHPVEQWDGCYANVVGLPFCSLTRLLESFELYPRRDIGRELELALGYRCPIFTDQTGSGNFHN